MSACVYVYVHTRACVDMCFLYVQTELSLWVRVFVYAYKAVGVCVYV